MAELIIQSGKLQGKRLVLPDKEVFIGRDDDCHVRLQSSLVSRKHCALKGTPEGLWVRDLASQNGTFVNEVPVSQPVLLKPGDVLQIGAVLFQVPAQKPMTEPLSAPGKTAEPSGRISDADIANWLSDSGEKDRLRPSDTTIIKNPRPPTTQLDVPAADPMAAAVPTPSATVAAPPVETLRRSHRTVKEQAAEIIRRHWAEVRGEVPPT